MINYIKDDDAEIAAISAISAALAKVTDDEARSRVLNYILSRYGPSVSDLKNFSVSSYPMDQSPLAAMSNPPLPTTSPLALSGPIQKEVPGIARLTESGDLKITARDLKAKSGLDAAVRLAHIAIYVYEQLTGGQPFSSRRGLTPLLQQWRVYDGNARAKLAKQRGIIRSGDDLTLDAHARRDAERYMEEILSDDIAGQWRPR